MRKTARDHRGVLLIVLIAAGAFPILFINAFMALPLEQIEGILKIPFIQSMINMLGGGGLTDGFTINTLGGFVFVHPVILSIGWAYVTIAATGAITGEFENGTADLLLSLPISRRRVYASVTMWIAISAPLIPLALWLGIWVGTRTVDMPDPMDLWRLRLVVINSAAMLLAVAGMAVLIAAVSQRRGRAMGFTFGLLLCLFLLNWLAAFWKPAEQLGLIGVMRYFRPYVILRENRLPIVDVSVLLGIAITTWTIGAIVYTRRDIHTS